ncbi:hypothetical protein cym2001_21940 [Pseudomonas sp. CYM-20-01]|nr:hypothetical protein cym2001_21940 [Pseudomonas sp. CYM-20-01]
MTSTSFNRPPVGCQGFAGSGHEPDLPAAGRGIAKEDPLGTPYSHAAETRRMKAFDGQGKFQAPVADDFCRGLTESGLHSVDDAKAPGSVGVFDGLKTWLRRQRGN